MKTVLAIGALLAALVPGIALDKPALHLATLSPCENTIQREPVLVFELAGSTFAGQVDRTLYVYGDGTLKLAQIDADGPGFCMRTQATPRTVAGLQHALLQADAMALCDDSRLVTDVPLHTLTMFNGTQDARAHTFSYWLGDGGYAAVDALLENFIVEQFP